MNVVLRVIDGPLTGKEYVFDRHATFIVGRSPQVDFPMPEDRFLSRDHFLVEFNPPICFLKDMGSTNGTKVNGLRVDEVRLADGDIISAGKSSFQVIVGDGRERGVPIRCLICQTAASGDVAVAAQPGDGPLTWLCDRCASQRRRFPTPPVGLLDRVADRRRRHGRGVQGTGRSRRARSSP